MVGTVIFGFGFLGVKKIEVLSLGLNGGRILADF